MIRWLCLLCCVALCLGDAVNVNQIFDQFLDGFRAKVKQEGKDVLPIKDIEGSKTWKKAFIKFTGEVRCRKGWVGHLATIKRTGDAVLTTQGNTMTVKLSLGLGNLEARFNECRVKASKLFSVTQPVEVKTSSNSISAQVSLIRDGNKCIPKLDFMNLDNLGHVKIKTGSNVFHNLEDLFLNLITKLFHKDIKNAINNELFDNAKKEIEKGDLCDKLPL